MTLERSAVKLFTFLASDGKCPNREQPISRLSQVRILVICNNLDIISSLILCISLLINLILQPLNNLLNLTLLLQIPSLILKCNWEEIIIQQLPLLSHLHSDNLRFIGHESLESNILLQCCLELSLTLSWLMGTWGSWTLSIVTVWWIWGTLPFYWTTELIVLIIFKLE